MLVSLATNPEYQGKEAVRMISEILQGKSPGDIDANKRPKIEMGINLRTAKTLGLSIPFGLLGTAEIYK